MCNYNYLENIIEDVKNWMHENADYICENVSDFDELETFLNDELWIVDEVTGNASGSYTFSTYKAEEYLAHNWDILEKALAEFGCDGNPIEKGAEWCDVTIRCYLLGQAISEVLEEIEDEEVA